MARGQAPCRTRCLAAPDTQRFREILKLTHLGGGCGDKALSVNLDDKFYGSFAEIGAGQEVSRTFLKAGAAAGTVARSISAYDMRMSDVSYGQAKRYVTSERVQQMLTTEFDEVEKCLREVRGPECRFFAFACTLAARAYKSNRECEGWIGVTYQAEAGQPRSTITLHVRMRDPTAQQQGEAIGVLGTNLIYLVHNTSDPYIITSYLLDGLEQNLDSNSGRLEIDSIDFSGPAFPEGSWDPRLMAMRMVQLRIANGVLLEPDKVSHKYRMAVPNNLLYKRPLVVERSRFTPVTCMHEEVMGACSRALEQEADESTKRPLEILNMQIDDIIQPTETEGPGQRLTTLKRVATSELKQDGMLDLAEVKRLFKGKLTDEETDALFKGLDPQSVLSVSIDALFSLTQDGVLAEEFLDRFKMLEPLKYTVLLSSISQTHDLASYLQRYTNQKIVVAVGGGGFSIGRALFNPESYMNGSSGGSSMLEGLGRLFSQGGTRVFSYPNITPEGQILPASIPDGDAQPLYEYLVRTGAIVPISSSYVSPEARDWKTNLKFRLGSHEVRELIAKGSAEWEKYMPPTVATIGKSQGWFGRLRNGETFTANVWQFLAGL